MSSPRRLIVGNWKMNGVPADLAEIDRFLDRMGAGPWPASVGFCPPFPLISACVARLKGTDALTGGQDCHDKDSGAHTGCVSAAMLAAIGAKIVIVGHSERRTDQGETDALMRAKALAAFRAGLTPIICVGETLAQRQAGAAEAVVRGQILASTPNEGAGELVIAYEPVWAIGTGLTPSLGQIEDMHKAARAALLEAIGPAAVGTSILYGGSVKGDNAKEILAIAGVDGALVGGASLKGDSFAAIVQAQSRG
jgi:triosephosphate isomerase (TIM)